MMKKDTIAAVVAMITISLASCSPKMAGSTTTSSAPNSYNSAAASTATPNGDAAAAAPASENTLYSPTMPENTVPASAN